ncbi:MAG: hypothetical protein RR572_04570 [Raoultibacter sp.]
MAEKKNKAAHFLHIKRHTEGTSNEISVSVLDARKKAVDSEETKEKKPRGFATTFSGVFSPSLSIKGGKTPSQAAADENALPAAANGASGQGGAFVDPEQEIAQRKQRRRSRRIFSGVTGVLLCALVLGTSSYFLATEYQKQQNHQSMLNEALGEIEQADKTIVAMDELINAPLDEENVGKIKGIQESLASANALLDSAEATARRAFDGMRDSADKEAAGQALSSITARKVMIDEGSRIMQATVNAHQAALEVSSAWEDILAADASARQAAAAVSSTTTANVALSKEKTTSALDQFTTAKAKLSTAAKAYASADMRLLNEYLNKRIEAMNYALISDEAIMVQDKKTADTNNEAYNKADAQATALAQQFPADPLQPIYAAYDTNTAASFAAYNEARRAVGAADSFLRDYLGTSGK